jgi:hypothetical protein
VHSSAAARGEGRPETLDHQLAVADLLPAQIETSPASSLLNLRRRPSKPAWSSASGSSSTDRSRPLRGRWRHRPLLRLASAAPCSESRGGRGRRNGAVGARLRGRGDRGRRVDVDSGVP